MIPSWNIRLGFWTTQRRVLPAIRSHPNHLHSLAESHDRQSVLNLSLVAWNTRAKVGERPMRLARMPITAMPDNIEYGHSFLHPSLLQHFMICPSVPVTHSPQ
jgi:prophage antirepressor-like protein